MAPAGTVAVMVVAFTTVNTDVTPLKRTWVIPLKLVPVMVTRVPIPPEVGVKLVMEGEGTGGGGVGRTRSYPIELALAISPEMISSNPAGDIPESRSALV